MVKEYNVAILGATGAVGRRMIDQLAKSTIPVKSVKLLASSRSAGTVLKFRNQDLTVEETTPDSFDGIDLVLSSAGGSVSKKFLPEAVKRGAVCVDNTSAFRMEEDVPLVVPEVNPEALKNHHGIIANPNCSTIQAVIPLKPIDDKYNIKRVIYSTYQAVSGAGRQGILDSENGLKGMQPKKFPYPIVDNCLPHIDIFLDDGYTKEEHKMIDETRKILNKPNLPITATTVRVPVKNCHSESINIEVEKDFDIYEVKQLLQNFPGIIVVDDISKNYYPIATKADGSDEILVGRIRRDYSVKNGLNIWCVGDNLRKGAATNAVQILEKLITK